jgi:hypothetical protein
MMANFNRTEIGARLASILLLLATAGLACDGGDDGSPKGLASILIEGASQTARYHVDGHAVEFPHHESATSPLVVSAGRHIIEVHEGEVVALREEIVLEPGETKTLRVKGGPLE